MKTFSTRISTFALSLILSSFQLFGQQPVEVTGQVKDEQSKESLPFCRVIALNQKDSIIRGGITDDNGFFRLPLNPGQYKFVVSFSGYENDTLISGLIREDQFLGVFNLKSDVLEVGEVKVEASSHIDNLDKDVQLITEELKVGATATKDVLDKITGISYDDYAGVLKVDSDANIMILVNGVEKSQEYIQNLDPERLIRVETIRDPGGRYGLEGYSAILNIILKRNYKGSELYVEQMQLVDIVANENRLHYMIGNLGLTYNYTHNDLNIYGSANVGRKNFLINSITQTEYADGVLVEEATLGSSPNTEILESDANFNLGFDYRINPKHIISFESNFRGQPLNLNQENIDYRTSIYSNDTLTDQFDFTTQVNTKRIDSYNSLFYIADFNERTKLNVNFTYSNYRENYLNKTLQEGVYDREEEGINKKHFTRGYIELDFILSRKTSIQVGYGNTWRKLSNDFSVGITDLNSNTITNTTSDFWLTDMRHKLYGNYSWRISKKWNTRIGIAAESSTPKVENLKRDYIIFQPMFDLRYAASKKLSMVLKYRTSSSYPSINESNPFTSLVNPRITTTGNPFLTPSTTHRGSIRMNIFQGLLAFEPYIEYSNNRVANVGELDEHNIFNFRFENAELYQRHGAKLNVSHFFKPGIILQGNFEAYQAKIVSTSKTNYVTDWRGDIDLLYMFRKSQTLIGLKYQRQQSKYISGLGYDKGDVDFWMLFYKQPLLKKKASIMFGYFLPINAGVNYNQGFYTQTEGIRMKTDIDVTLIKNMFLLEFSYRFSKGKSVKRNEKEIERDREENGGGLF